MVLDQYVERPSSKVNANNTIVIDKDELINGYGIVRVIPGPVFSIAAYVGSLTFINVGQSKLIIGAITGAIALFLPSIFILFFLYKVYKYTQLCF